MRIARASRNPWKSFGRPVTSADRVEGANPAMLSTSVTRIAWLQAEQCCLHPGRQSSESVGVMTATFGDRKMELPAHRFHLVRYDRSQIAPPGVEAVRLVRLNSRRNLVVDCVGNVIWSHATSAGSGIRVFLRVCGCPCRERVLSEDLDVPDLRVDDGLPNWTKMSLMKPPDSRSGRQRQRRRGQGHRRSPSGERRLRSAGEQPIHR